MPRRKKTDKEFQQEVFNLVGNEYTFIESYVKNSIKIKVKHNKCGNIYKVAPSNFLKGSRCPYCYRKSRKITNAQFKKEVKKLVGNEYEFLDTYINSKTKIKVKHNKCGHTYKVQPNSFFNGSRCPYCYGTSKKTDTQFKKEVLDLVGNKYTFLDSYQDNHTKLRVKHNKCGHVYKIEPISFLRGSLCPYCVGNARKTDTQFKQEVLDLVGNEYKFLDTYVNIMTKIRVRHNECGNVYEVRPNDFIRGRRCPYCYGNLKKTDAQFKQEVFNLVGNEYTFLESYVDNKTKLRVKHNKCGNIYKVTPGSFLQGSRCPYCCWGHKKTGIEFTKQIFDLVGSEYIFLDSYIDAQTKIKVKHNKCGNIYKVAPYHFLEGHRCPYCNSPKGETLITKILDTLNIKYEPQKTFDELRDVQPLSYDFYIQDQNILIEYQGKQHYQPVDHFGGEAKFELQQKHDKMKAEYAKDNGYNLITVPYTEDTFSKIKKYLFKYGLQH